MKRVTSKQEQVDPDDEVLGFNGWGFPIERPPKREQCGTCKGKLCIGEGSKDDPIRSCPSCDPKALAKQDQSEPVAWMTIDPNGEEDDIWYENPEGKLLEGWTYKPLYTTPQPKQEQCEPVIDKSAAIRIATALGWEPKRTWVGLTDEDEIDWEEGGSLRDLVKAIETKLKELNT
jgi:hypothetical protein